MRLQQVRDWLGGQSWGDLRQYRLGMGTPMHWSRLADLGLALLIVSAKPLFGTHHAEVLAVIIWPSVLFGGALMLIGLITRQLDRTATRTAMVVAAIAYPATTIFVPGRIDHHGLQLVLLLGATLAAASKPTLRNGAITGALATTSLVVGMETMPFFAILGSAALIGWALVPADGHGRIVGLGIGTLAMLGISVLGFAGWQWRYPACDGFTLQAATGLAIMATVPLAVMLLSHRVTLVRFRLAIAAAVSTAALAFARSQSPTCMSPYGHVPVLLRRLWLDHVSEAQSVISAPVSIAFGYLGVMLAGLAASAWIVSKRPCHNGMLLLALQCTAVLIASVQLRGAYAGTMLGAPALAIMIGAARQRGPISLVAAWGVSAGMLYPITAEAITSSAKLPLNPAGSSACTSPAMMQTLARLRPGVVMAPIDVGPWGIAATQHRFVAGPYHRNIMGNLAMYRFFHGDIRQARAIAQRWNVHYVLYCSSDFGGVRPATDSIAQHLANRSHLYWLKPLGNLQQSPLFEVVQ
jgi:hypothetical protein